MSWPWEREFWRLGAPPPDPGASPGSRARSARWGLDAAFADRHGRIHCVRGDRTITGALYFGASGGVGPARGSVDAAERLCARMCDDPDAGSAILAVTTARPPGLAWGRWRPLDEAFPGLPWSGLDAALRLDRPGASDEEHDLVYMFRGREFLCYYLAARATRPGYPRPIAGSWYGLWEGDLDAAVNTGRGKVFFIKGSSCSRYDIARQRVEEGYPRSFDEVFPGMPTTWSEIECAVCPGRAGEIVFFRGKDVLVYRDTEAARQLSLAESEARARVEGVLGGDSTELVESLNRARREDRSRGVSRTGVFDSVLADVRRHAELASSAAAFAAMAARISEETVARIGVTDLEALSDEDYDYDWEDEEDDVEVEVDLDGLDTDDVDVEFDDMNGSPEREQPERV